MRRSGTPPTTLRGWLALGSAIALAASCAAPATPGPSPSPAVTSAPQVTDAPTATPEETPTPDPTPPALPTSGEWTRIAIIGEAPAPREAHSWTIDPATGLAYLFGGRDGATVFDDLWRFDPRAELWERLRPGGSLPRGRFGHEAVWLEGRGLVVFAGQAGADFFNDLWLYDPSLARWSELPSGGDRPVPRYGSCAVLGTDGRLWISHGFTEDGIRFADTRAYDFADGTWSDATPLTGDLPVARCLHRCFEAADGRFVLFGGQTTGVPALNDLWALTLFTEADRWSEVKGDLPAPRNLYAFATTGAAFVAFGGGSLERGYLADTWAFSLFDLGGRELATTGGPPPARSAAALIEDAAGQRLLLFGGRDGSQAFADLWSLRLR